MVVAAARVLSQRNAEQCGIDAADMWKQYGEDFIADAQAALNAAALAELLAACLNARDMLATDRQAFVDCQRLRDGRTDDPIAHGLVQVDEETWIAPEDA